MRFLKRILFYLLIFSSFHGIAQSTNIHRKSLFLSFNVDTELSSKLTFSNLFHHRQIDFSENSRLFLYRPNLQYKLPNNLDFGVGYWYIKTTIPRENASPLTRNEHRIWEYLKYDIGVHKVELRSRLAFEQRMRSELKSDSNGRFIDQSLFIQRLRYRFNIEFDLVTFSNNKAIKTTISEEVRIRFWSGLNESSFDQNNTYLYLGYDLGTQTRLRIGYGLDYIKINSDLFLVNNATRVRFNYRFDLRKKK